MPFESMRMQRREPVPCTSRSASHTAPASPVCVFVCVHVCIGLDESVCMLCA